MSPGWADDTLFALPDWGQRRDISRLDGWMRGHGREAPWHAWHAWPSACWLGAGLGLDLGLELEVYISGCLPAPWSGSESAFCSRALLVFSTRSSASISSVKGPSFEKHTHIAPHLFVSSLTPHLTSSPTTTTTTTATWQPSENQQPPLKPSPTTYLSSPNKPPQPFPTPTHSSPWPAHHSAPAPPASPRQASTSHTSHRHSSGSNSNNIPPLTCGNQIPAGASPSTTAPGLRARRRRWWGGRLMLSCL